MVLRVSFELDEDDLKHFRLIMREARKSAARLAPEEIVASAEQLLKQIAADRVPRFISERLAKLATMIDMLADEEWRLPNKDATRVLNALAYFTEPEDLIPDHIPGLGFLDDAIMIELVVRELRHEVEAYRDFCEFRSKQLPRRGIKRSTTRVTREQWLEGRRQELQARMHRRRAHKGKPGDPKKPLNIL